MSDSTRDLRDLGAKTESITGKTVALVLDMVNSLIYSTSVTRVCSRVPDLPTGNPPDVSFTHRLLPLTSSNASYELFPFSACLDRCQRDNDE